jgi:hypothetical protein
VPAAAVIPAPIAYIKVVVVKKLVVEARAPADWSASPRALVRPGLHLLRNRIPFTGGVGETGRLL